MLNTKSMILKLASIFLLASSFQIAKAAEVNMPGLNGSITNTFTSGFSMRVAENNCLLTDGYNSNAHTNAGTIAMRTARGQDSTLDYIIGGSGKGCAVAKTDNYGNTTNKAIDVGNSNTNDGRLNFEKGDIFSATQALYSKFSGMTDGGLGIDFSFTASVDPALDINAPQFKEFTTDAKDAFENDVTLLDFYISGSQDFGDSYIDYTFGRNVTSWGEATFIPIGMNGMVTNPLDLTKLQSPSAGIREALIPIETLTLSTGLNDGSTLEAYYQFSHDYVGIGANGSYFGSETFGPGSRTLIATGANRYETLHPDMCPGLMVVNPAGTNGYGKTYAAFGLSGAGQACNLTSANAISLNQTGNTYKTVNTLDLAFAGLKQMDATAVALSLGVGSAHQYVTGDANSAGNIAGGSSANIARFLTSVAALEDPLYTNGGTVDLRPSSTDGKFKAASDSGQFGLKWSKYFDDVGTGLDLSFSYANYHSKVPYIQFSMPGNLFAEDALGAYLLSAADAQGSNGVFAGNAVGTFQIAGMQNIYSALINAAMSSGVCGAVTKGNLATMLGYTGATSEQQEAAMNAMYYTEISEGRYTHDASRCVGTALGFSTDSLADGAFTSLPDLAGAARFAVTGLASDYTITYNETAAAAGAALIGTGARLFAAVTPINFIDYRGIFPEDLQVFALSGSTNVSGTTIQAELAYRPNFPLATGAGNQINQLNDKNGANDALNMVAVAGINAANAAGLQTMINQICTVSTGSACTNSAFFYGGLAAYERSDLGNVLDANGNETNDLTVRYYSKPFIRYDVLSGTIGTTTSFNASHPVTQGLGADSSVFLSEVGFVNVMGMNNGRYGHIARGGWNEGVAAGTNKCLGAFGTTQAGLSGSAAALTNIGSGVVDALFGNGGYCEDKPGADDFALTYRLIGSATYNNINNSQWSFAPNFAWSHDPMGYAPSSLGGFVEGRQSLSLGANFSRNDLTVSTSYTDYLGEIESQLNGDKDYLSVSVSYAF
ncbi:DUF1302 domain-containing protein [Pelagibacteraceae bacterium]|nr:DUF1302 domain-containing protein [Pelagibacteraceae bacterium]